MPEEPRQELKDAKDATQRLPDPPSAEDIPDARAVVNALLQSTIRGQNVNDPEAHIATAKAALEDGCISTLLETLLEAENERVVKTVVQDIVQYGLGLEKLLRSCERPEDRAAVLKLLPAIKSITKRGYATGQFNIEMMRSAVVGGKNVQLPKGQDLADIEAFLIACGKNLPKETSDAHEGSEKQPRAAEYATVRRAMQYLNPSYLVRAVVKLGPRSEAWAVLRTLVQQGVIDPAEVLDGHRQKGRPRDGRAGDHHYTYALERAVVCRRLAALAGFRAAPGGTDQTDRLKE